MSETFTAIGLRLGYSHIFKVEELTDNYRNLLRKLFGNFTELQFHVEQVSKEVSRLTVMGNLKGLIPIYEQFAGENLTSHRTKNGNFLWIAIHPLSRVLMFSQFANPHPSEQEEAAPVAVN